MVERNGRTPWPPEGPISRMVDRTVAGIRGVCPDGGQGQRLSRVGNPAMVERNGRRQRHLGSHDRTFLSFDHATPEAFVGTPRRARLLNLC